MLYSRHTHTHTHQNRTVSLLFHFSGKLDLQDILQCRAKVLTRNQGHKVVDSSSSASEDLSYEDKFLNTGLEGLEQGTKGKLGTRLIPELR